MNRSELKTGLQRITEARHHDPFSILGRHREGKNRDVVRVWLPNAETVMLVENKQIMKRLPGSDFFEWKGRSSTLPARYQVHWTDVQGQQHTHYDPYCFPPQLTDFDRHLFAEGKHWHAYRFLGAHSCQADGIDGVLFSVWAPNAERVSVVGDFNQWDGRYYPMRMRDGGVWELFIPALTIGTLYKYEIRNRDSGEILLKADPYAQHCEMRPNTASIVTDGSGYQWQDTKWLQKRKARDWLHAPMSIYEVHLGSWQQGENGTFLNYRELAHRLVDYVKDMGFSHIELLPITEHPFDGSWGYQTTGYYAPTSRYGTPEDFRYFVDYCHQHEIGVFLDWVPAHFPKDAHGLARFDGTALYEHADPRQGEHLDWSTLIYNYSRNEVKNFLLSNAFFWLEEFHLDGLRVDAVASMLYLDYSREDWIPNKFGGRENLEAIEFMRELNTVSHGEHPGTLIMAEESTSWPQVTRPTYLGGLGFSMKWNMGWMNDTLSYMNNNPVYRKYHHEMLTFSMLYAFTENFLLPFSHDEVVHGKGSMLNKMPGDEWQRFANLRLLYTYMFTHPGKKLLFMGTEFAQGQEWNAAAALDWYVLDYPLHQGVKSLVKDLNHLYHNTPALHQFEFEWQGFDWVNCHDAEQSVLSYLRKNDEESFLVILNMTPEPREAYRLGLEEGARYQEIFNSDSEYYSGSNMGNGQHILETEAVAWADHPHSLCLTLPPLAGIILRRI
ncbi:1,4-alpha-glucan branching protein GlgB [Candidatus Venteria ishoeyi]|uniref:1,4-alpha-glucan branching protein GlgB n=1 Tax=Candidatus Venteria ishoeyi TaxID=1899563 RepID=UPI0025A56072|nr:1,4-alpha-glucan branching protein GlgB [Candidatus Venteria ishoeyi]MDM8547336.1 1,4-alpha-glucan branching protein GlgB [Candidatus Venteria ishoeyi]